MPSAPTGRDGVTIPPGPWEGEWNHTDDSRVSERNKANFKIELENVVRSLKNHPSIIQWIVFNENWGQFSTMENTQKVLDMDPNRLVTAASGFTDFEIGHIQDYIRILIRLLEPGIRVCLLLIIPLPDAFG